MSAAAIPRRCGMRGRISMRPTIRSSSPSSRARTGAGATSTRRWFDMARTLRILVQTTTPYAADDWSVERLSLLTSHLATLGDETRVDVTARNREAGPDGSDPVLASLDRSPFDELWLFAFDTGGGLS